MSGKVYTELPLPKGTPIFISLHGYNLLVPSANPATTSSPVRSYSCIHGRNQDLWGPDADVFRPERWFEMNEQVESPVGVYGNLYGYAWSSGGVVGY